MGGKGQRAKVLLSGLKEVRHVGAASEATPAGGSNHGRSVRHIGACGCGGGTCPIENQCFEGTVTPSTF